MKDMWISDPHPVVTYDIKKDELLYETIKLQCKTQWLERN